MKKPEILLVDDEKSIVHGLGKLLTNRNYEVSTAGSGNEAIGMLSRQGFDLIISDVVMDNGTGLDLLKAAKELDPDVQVILLTAFGNVENTVGALRLGANDFMSKPVNDEELFWRVEKCLKNREDNFKVSLYEDILPVCGGCYKIKDLIPGQEPKWYSVDEYLIRKTTTRVSHGLCPACAQQALAELED